jgi:outer membrane protein OmpA-like peptidoglycan-associated protein
LSHREVIEETSQVPIWIITFSDMTTNLLTFFVLLVSLGTMRDDTLNDQGMAPTFLGKVKMGFGFKQPIALGETKINYNVSGPDEQSDGRTINAREEDLRRAFEEIRLSANVVPSRLIADQVHFSTINVHFDTGQSRLSEQGKKVLTDLCTDLKQSRPREPIKLYVLGLAPDVKSEKEQWTLSALRAETAAKVLRDTLSSMTDSQMQSNSLIPMAELIVYSLGAGPGGEWTGPEGPGSQNSHILIADLRNN